MFLHEQALASLDDQLGACTIGHVVFQQLFLMQVTMVVRLRVWIWLPVVQIREKISLLFVQIKAALLLLQRVDLFMQGTKKCCKTLRMLLRIIININTTTHTNMVQFKANGAGYYFVLLWLAKERET